MTPQIFLETDRVGTVKWFSLRRGYGFINCHKTKKDVFVHRSAIANKNSSKFSASLEDGELVYFDVVSGRQGLPEAANVIGPRKSPVKKLDMSNILTLKVGIDCTRRRVFMVAK